VAAELEQGRDGGRDSLAALVDVGSRTPSLPAPAERADTTTAVGFASAHLVAGQRVADLAAEDALSSPDVLCLSVVGESHARQAALLATAGELQETPARRRRQGRLTEAALGARGDMFLRYQGTGELWLTLPVGHRQMVALTLVEDVLYLREQRVVAFDGEVVWEAGRVPGGGPRLLQFRGSGRVVIEAGAGEVVTLPVPGRGVINVAPARLLGWMGRVVAQGVRQRGVCVRVACEGEGVLLLSRHGDSAQPVHQRPEPGNHGPGPAGARGPAPHR
jgi:uncharacterized protein (AIM24 family)